jgi:hypothetical protein
MNIDESVLREALANAKDRSLIVYRNTRKHAGAARSGAFALGRYEGFREALRLLASQRDDDRGNRAAGDARLRSSPGARPLFSGIFQKLRPKHGPSVLGRW